MCAVVGEGVETKADNAGSSGETTQCRYGGASGGRGENEGERFALQSVVHMISPKGLVFYDQTTNPVVYLLLQLWLLIFAEPLINLPSTVMCYVT